MAPMPKNEERSDRGQRISQTLEAAELAAQNPRVLQVDAQTVQRRNDISAELLSFYSFLTSLYVPAEALKRPPNHGWEFINAERFAYLGKTDAVIDLYKHIPYIEWETGDHRYPIRPDCICMDYAGRYFRGTKLGKLDSVDPDKNVVTDELAWHKLEQAQHIAIIAVSAKANDGDYIAIDIRDGITALIERGRGEADDIREYGSIAGLLEECKYDLRTLEYVPLSSTDVVPDNDSHIRAVPELKDTYRRYGWPDNFQKEAAFAAVEQALDVSLHKNEWLYGTA